MRLYVARRKQRKALYLPMQRTPDQPGLIFPLPQKMERGRLDELVRSQLDKLGVSSESEVQALVDRAEADYELRRKVEEVTAEIRRLMQLKSDGAKLMSVGHKKWAPAFYRPVVPLPVGRKKEDNNGSGIGST